MPTLTTTPSMETSVASMPPPQASPSVTSSLSPITTDAKLGKRTSALNAPKDGTSTKKESAVRFPHSVVNSTEPKEFANHAIKATPSSITAASLLTKILDALNGMATFAKDAPKDGG